MNVGFAAIESRFDRSFYSHRMVVFAWTRSKPVAKIPAGVNQRKSVSANTVTESFAVGTDLIGPRRRHWSLGIQNDSTGVLGLEVHLEGAAREGCRGAPRIHSGAVDGSFGRGRDYRCARPLTARRLHGLVDVEEAAEVDDAEDDEQQNHQYEGELHRRGTTIRSRVTVASPPSY